MRKGTAHRHTTAWPGLVSVVLGLAAHPQTARACAACYGQSDSPMAVGMNWGILSLLAVIVSVLVGIVAFFVVLAIKSARAEAVHHEAEPAQLG